MKSLLKVVLMLSLAGNAWALSSDSEQPIYIDSDTQTLNMKSNKVTFQGDVKLVQGSIELEADKVIVIRNAEDGSINSIESFGEPATFKQVTDEGSILRGKAKELFYDVAKDLLYMRKEAQLMQDDSNIKGNTIRYDISTETMVADGGNGSRVTTVLQPQAAENK